MKMLLTLSVAITVCAGCLHGSFKAGPREQDGWKIWVEDGKTTDPLAVNLLKAKMPLDNYEANLALIHPWDYGERASARVIAHRPEVTAIGEWHEYTVYDVTDKAQKIKQIILKDPSGNHRVLYSQLPWCTASVNDIPCIITVEDTRILAYRTRVPGTGHFYMEHYFVQDPRTGLPVDLDMSSIETTLKEILPQGHGVWKGGGLDIESLTFKHFVWKEGDGNSRPTGGRVEIKFKIEGAKLVPVDSRYEPAPAGDGE
jgi:hypothetical protein